MAFGRGGYECIGLDLSSTGIEEAKQLLAEQKEPINGKVRARVSQQLDGYLCSAAAPHRYVTPARK